MESMSWEDRDGGRWVMLEGELDHAACLELRERFDRAVDGGEGDVVVVLEGVSFLCSMAVGLLLSARERLQESGRRLRLNGIQPAVRDALDLMKLGDVFDEV